MDLQVEFAWEMFLTYVALEFALVVVDLLDVSVEVAQLDELLVANLAHMHPLSCVRTHVTIELTQLSDGSATVLLTALKDSESLRDL